MDTLELCGFYLTIIGAIMIGFGGNISYGFGGGAIVIPAVTTFPDSIIIKICKNKEKNFISIIIN